LGPFIARHGTLEVHPPDFEIDIETTPSFLSPRFLLLQHSKEAEEHVSISKVQAMVHPTDQCIFQESLHPIPHIQQV
jgi:hypothetical protein